MVLKYVPVFYQSTDKNTKFQVEKHLVNQFKYDYLHLWISPHNNLQLVCCRFMTKKHCSIVMQEKEKTNFSKVSRYKEDLYSRPCAGLVFAMVMEKFSQKCDNFEVAESQRLSVLHCVLCGEELQYFSESI